MTVASTPFGAVRGAVRDGVRVFCGIRFAQAGRFAAPTLVTRWDGVLDATVHGAQCPQVPGILERALGGTALPMDEDCLHLDVYTPGCDDARRPVLVWVHGGAFVTGTGAMPWYDGCALARRADVVVVTINYRLGVFGFLGTRNVGLDDQLAALRWVHDAIGSFGGDPGAVTVVGESAGGASVIALLASPASAGLVQRAWAMSPSIVQLRSAERALEAEQQLLAAAGVATAADLVPWTARDLLDAQARVLAHRAGAMTAFSPATDDRLLPGDAVALAAERDVPLVVGTTRDEMQLFTAFDPAVGELSDEGLLLMAQRRFGERAAEAVEVYEQLRPGASIGQLASAIQTDETFRVPAWRLAERRAGAGRPTWMYWFTWASPAFGGVLGSCHGLDIPFAFSNLDQPGVTQFTGDGDDRRLVADAFSGALVRFARTGEPGWPRFDLGSRATLRIDVATEVLHDPERAIRELWT
jgi:para-nitrobenzyl esterase